MLCRNGKCPSLAHVSYFPTTKLLTRHATRFLFQVTILNESHFPDWNISEFRMMRGDTVRSIKHFHFTTWPDFGEYIQTNFGFVRGACFSSNVFQNVEK